MKGSSMEQKSKCISFMAWIFLWLKETFATIANNKQIL